MTYKTPPLLRCGAKFLPPPLLPVLPNSRSVSLAVGQDGWLVVAEAAEEEEVVPREGVIYVVL